MENKKEKVGISMKNHFIIDKKELTCTYINLIIAKMFFTYPRMLVLNSGSAAWIQMVYVTILSFGLFLIVNKLNKRSEMNNIFDLSEQIGGKFLRIIVGILLFGVLIINLAMNIRIFSESIRTVLLPNTPTSMVMLLFILAISIGAYTGIYSICRIHSLFMPIAAIVMVIFFIMLIPDINLSNIFPLAGLGTYNIFISGLESLSLFSDVMTIYILLPFCKNKRDIKISISYSFLIGGLSSVVMILIYTLVYPYPISGEFIIPVYQLARIVNIGHYFQRFEALFEFTWSIAMMLYSAFYLFVVCYTFTETFKIKYYKEVIIPVVLLAASLGFIPTNFVNFLSDGHEITTVIFPILYIVPAITGLLYMIKHRERRRRN